MSHKVRVDVKFENLEQFLQMKQYLENAGLKFQHFVNFAVNDVWNRMLEEYAKQLREQADAAASLESSGDMAAASGDTHSGGEASAVGQDTLAASEG